MRVALTFLSILCCLSSSCRREKAASVSDTTDKEPSSAPQAISLEYLDSHQEEYLDRDVVVAAFLCTHEEGPWIASNPRIPFAYSMSLEITKSSEILAKNPTRFRWWFEAQDGYPVILSGVFRRRDKKTSFGVSHNHPFIEVSQAREVGADDPVWASFKINSEQ